MARTIRELLSEVTDKINAAAEGSYDEVTANGYRQGLLAAAEAEGWNVGALLIEQDLRQMDAGQWRPMCGGVWLRKGPLSDEERNSYRAELEAQ